MSSIWRPPTSSRRQQELAWRNTVFQVHDFFCHCDDPDLHFLIVMNKFNGAPKPEPEIKNIKCLLTGNTATTEATEDKEETGFYDGELEKLFQETDGTKEEEPDAAR